MQCFTGAFDRQDTAVVGQRVQDHRGVLARLDHFVEIADGAFTYRAGQRAIIPVGRAIAYQVPPHQVGRCQVVVTGHRIEGPPQARRHMLDKARLAAAGRALEQHRQLVAVRVFKQLYLTSLRLVERDVLAGHRKLLYFVRHIRILP